MTEQTITEHDELEEAPEESDVPAVQSCEITFSINVSNVRNLTEAVNVAAIQLMRFGLDAFYLEATDMDTDEVYIIHNGDVMRAEDVAADFEDLKEEIQAQAAADDADNEDPFDDDHNHQTPEWAGPDEEVPVAPPVDPEEQAHVAPAADDD